MRTGSDRFSLARIIGAAAFVVASFGIAVPGASAGADDNVTGWLWSGTIGWISLNCTTPAPSTCGTVDYGVTLTDTPGQPGRADLSGWAWSENMGWICFGATCAGTTPEGGAAYAQYRDSFVGEGGATKTDQFFGWAKLDSLGNDGWISLNCDSDPTTLCAASSHHVVLDTAIGDFTKAGAFDHWGWNGTSAGTGIGWIDFSQAHTTWTTAKVGLVRRPEGVYEPASGLQGTHLTAFSIKFDDVSATQNSRLECDLAVADSSAVLKTVGYDFAATVHLSDIEQINYTMLAGDSLDRSKRWKISACRIAAPPNATACAADAACAPNGVCDEILGKCRNVLVTTTPKQIFTHPGSWTGLGDAEDWYLAVKCFAGFPGAYMANSEKCDFGGDASYAQTMFKQMPVEGNCGDGIDNNSNGQTDCADFSCKGISYNCVDHAAATCTWSQTGDNVADCSEPGYVFGSLCCTRQNTIVNGLECALGSANDGYADCGDVGAFSGDVCCTNSSEVIIKP